MLGPITVACYEAERHVLGPRGASDQGPIDNALAALGLERRIATAVTGFASALALVAAVPERHTGNMRAELFSFPLPFAVPEVTMSPFWHPRLEADPAHRWLRACVREVCSEP